MKACRSAGRLGVLFLGMSLQGTYADGEPDVLPGDELEPATYRLILPPITDIDIEVNGGTKKAAEGGPEDCSGFQLKEQDVRLFLRSARRISERDFSHTINWTACFARGKVDFAGGSTGQWMVGEDLGGSLFIAPGRQFYLYCPKCRFKGPAPGRRFSAP
ncbi:hypothetical protein OOT46_11110 [Aquabacterium sp. A7-Y]|uniref:hypothetical protein n=1 Tax=Aquabacterium sp. A7-Y TaxID=1349605 RepID=UPI00223CDDDD|nr:hypothetical protein [Aquabacterium sp. A7-Y]MCW7538388.1 hypothetical protein [Aquabacterium sp. A7-Y]